MPQNIVNALSTSMHIIRGTVIVTKKNVLDFNDLSASLLDRLHEFVGKRVSLQLISAVQADPGQFYFFIYPMLSSSISHVCFASCSQF